MDFKNKETVQLIEDLIQIQKGLLSQLANLSIKNPSDKLIPILLDKAELNEKNIDRLILKGEEYVNINYNISSNSTID